jgi:hypothetical protein
MSRAAVSSPSPSCGLRAAFGTKGRAVYVGDQPINDRFALRSSQSASRRRADDGSVAGVKDGLVAGLQDIKAAILSAVFFCLRQAVPYRKLEDPGMPDELDMHRGLLILQ